MFAGPIKIAVIADDVDAAVVAEDLVVKLSMNLTHQLGSSQSRKLANDVMAQMDRHINACPKLPGMLQPLHGKIMAK